ncbi:unnamed protein product [Paramecium primaurelia]|uniref:Uncharacterized protein n=1 Tax=Paramecium primaurelia TaxID=5886 RepID=A0A8S1QRA4_PARPR|nr:unnamed protein product [Paramecium primaurelia]
MLKLLHVINEHSESIHSIFHEKSNELISGDSDGFIIIWSSNNNQWNCSQTIKAHNKAIQFLIMNNNEDIFISSRSDNTIKFWNKQKEWIYQSTINDYTSPVYQLSLNDEQNKVISCGMDEKILIIKSGFQFKILQLNVMDNEYALSTIINSYFNHLKAIRCMSIK